MKQVFFLVFILIAPLKLASSGACVPGEIVSLKLEPNEIVWEVGGNEDEKYIATFLPSKIGLNELFEVEASVDINGAKLETRLELEDNGDGTYWVELIYSGAKSMEIEYTALYSKDKTWCVETLYEYEFSFKPNKI